MTGYQSARSAVSETVAEFMERRRAEIARLGHDAEVVGRDAWAAATRAGDRVVASTPSEVRALGAQILGGGKTPVNVMRPAAITPRPATSPHPNLVDTTARRSTVQSNTAAAQYGTLQAPLPSAAEMLELRRQQAAFADTTRKIDIQNSWFAAPVLAAPLAIVGLEAGAALAGRAMVRPAEEAVLNFVERDPYVRVGDNWATRAGRRAHAALKGRL